MTHACLTTGPNVLFVQKEKDRYVAVLSITSRRNISNLAFLGAKARDFRLGVTLVLGFRSGTGGTGQGLVNVKDQV